MPAIRARDLRRLTESMGERACHRHLREALESGQLKPEDFSIRDLAEEMIPDGREFVRLCDPRSKGAGIDLLEAGNAVNTAQFSNITGQIVYSKLMDAYMSPAFTITALIPTVPTTLNGEKIAGVTDIGDHADVVGEGDGYPMAGVSENYIETPATVKRGLIVPITKEAIFFDRTGLVLQRAAQVGESLGINKEKRACNCLIDENTTAHRYKWRGTVIATYGDNSGTHTWDNLAASNALENWTDFDAAELLLSAMLDPDTGEPITAMADTVIVTPQLSQKLLYILRATGVAIHSGGYATSGELTQTLGVNPVGNQAGYSNTYTPVVSKWLRDRLGTDTTWFLGAPRKAFAYMENWPITVVQAPNNSEAEFTQDIVARYKASERGAYATIEPRLMIKSTA